MAEAFSETSALLKAAYAQDEMLLPMPTDGTPMSVYRVRCPFCERRPLNPSGNGDN